jgi:hypothetical protein
MKKNWICLGVDPHPPVARVLGKTAERETILKARLRPIPSHSRALVTLLEAIALWQDLPVSGVLAVGAEEPWCDMENCHVGDDAFGKAPLDSIETVCRLDRCPRRDQIKDMGSCPSWMPMKGHRDD